VVIVSGTQSLFGRMITDPIETVSRVGTIWRSPLAC
jgi:NCS1 family nucleobase:cation symporter-1